MNERKKQSIITNHHSQEMMNQAIISIQCNRQGGEMPFEEDKAKGGKKFARKRTNQGGTQQKEKRRMKKKPLKNKALSTAIVFV